MEHTGEAGIILGRITVRTRFDRTPNRTRADVLSLFGVILQSGHLRQLRQSESQKSANSAIGTLANPPDCKKIRPISSDRDSNRDDFRNPPVQNNDQIGPITVPIRIGTVVRS